MPPPHTDFYSVPHYYDILHAPGTAHDVDVLERLAARHVTTGRVTRTAKRRPSQVWLEPACGTARYLRLAARRGYRVLGFDISEDMIDYARDAARGALGAIRGVPRPRLFTADMQDFDTGRRIPRVDFAFNLINTIRHVTTDARMIAHLRAIARVLRPGGAYAVGISLSAYGLEQPTEDVWEGRRGRLRVSQVIQFIPPYGARGEAARTERVISHLTVVRPTGETHIDSTYALRGYDLNQWNALIDRSPLAIAAVADSEGKAAKPAAFGYYVFILKHRAQ